MTLSSCLYTGRVVHRRFAPRTHQLRYRVFWMLLDLNDVDDLSKRVKFFSRNRFNLASFFDADHGDGSGVPLLTQAQTLLRRAGCQTDRIAIKLLCMPRILGYGFNPLSVYFCLRIDGSLEAIIYEVHNTFGERHSYVMPVHGAATEFIEQHCPKEFYVSPFLGMDMSYAFRVRPPGLQVEVSIHGKQNDRTVIAASLSGTRHELTDRALIKAFAGHPLLTLKVIAGIHWHALRMVLKGFRICPRERTTQGAVKAANGQGMQP
ncbi:DUF1365 domain-containing protein [Bradyrhizobium sp. CCGB20]|uniref:DUF1365 domain-containing protein n=1 Tax=Bradyrhizobium sp. CCGB20 TaxID=2949633 RepID=UPI0020B21751|nr:DUF1365 family protein [Bradyrhizobium sp. CCGB20]MCP3400293.1 DUF1365 family protein [Bradyrhizobium sp. CCGB20]